MQAMVEGGVVLRGLAQRDQGLGTAIVVDIGDAQRPRARQRIAIDLRQRALARQPQRAHAVAIGDQPQRGAGQLGHLDASQAIGQPCGHRRGRRHRRRVGA
ncbi:MAG: hypothetical protein IPN32_03215 [Deltaproteobacteria bacterium]|nr:hypothetical protein [Deltaproteobacteria bacterium]